MTIDAIYERIAADDFAWARRELVRAYGVAQRSPDPSTQNGAIIYDSDLFQLAVGANDFPPGISPETVPGVLERPKKYAFIEHAERQCCFRARGTVLVAAWAACADCARAIVLSGVKILVRHDRSDLTGRWNESIAYGDEIMQHGGVTIVGVAGTLGAPPVLFNGQEFHP